MALAGFFCTLEPNAPGVNLLNPASAPQPNIALQLTPTASLLVPYALRAPAPVNLGVRPHNTHLPT
jgi:hypothetical protein